MTGSWSFRLMDALGSVACLGSEVFALVVGDFGRGFGAFLVWELGVGCVPVSDSCLTSLDARIDFCCLIGIGVCTW